MLSSADILIANMVTLGAVLVAVFAVGFVISRVFLRAIGALLRRIDATGELHRRWIGQLSRLFAVMASVIGLALLGGAVLLTSYEVDAAAFVRAWVMHSLLADPIGVAWAAAKLSGLLFGAAALYFVVRSVLRMVGDLLARTDAFAARKQALDLLVARLIVTLRSVCLFGALLTAAKILTSSAAVLGPLAALTYIVVGVSLARSVAAAAHLAIDVAFALSGALAGKPTALRHFGHLQRLAGVTRRVADYFIYVGAATIVSHQLAPDTWLADVGQVVIRVIAILYVSRVVVEVVEVMLRETLGTRAPNVSEKDFQQRMTLVPVASSLVRYTIYIFSVAMALSELGLDTTPLFAAAGLMGIAVGLGAQAIVSDLVSGFFILFEGLFLIGHRVQIGDVLGTIEEIGVRVTRVRDDFGVLHAIPNGEIRTVSSYSQGYVNAIVEFGVPHDEDLARVFAVVHGRLAELRAESSEIQGESQIVVQELRESSLWIRTVTRVAPGQDDPACESIRYAIATALTAAQIRPPHAYRVVRQALERTTTRDEAP